MALIPVHFEYRTGLRQPFIVTARISGNWNAQGRLSEQWSSAPMMPFTADDGCPAFRATVDLDDGQISQVFRWGVSVDTAARPNLWGITTEVSALDSREQYCQFTLAGPDQTVRYHLTHCRRLGANKLFVDDQSEPAIRFAVWAPNATSVQLVRGEAAGGYVYNDGELNSGRIAAIIPMHRDEGGIWTTNLDDAPALTGFREFDHTPYMFRVTKDDGSIAYRTDIFSRCQIGSGRKNPETARQGEAPWDGTRHDLDGTKSCSVVIDPERVAEQFREVDANGRPVWPERRWLSEEEFWRDEFDPTRPLPTRLDDLVIYELHVDGLGLGRGAERGTLEDAIDLLDYLVDLGVNSVELLPMSEFEGWSGWGYATSHYMAIEYAGGGRDQFKHFIRECHRRGIAVILDVVYNHYSVDAERAEWMYDTNDHERNIYYWYEGRPSDYAAYEETARRNPAQTAPGHGGYVDNLSTGYAPRYWDEMVRKMFISSAAALVSEFHLDGFRVDQTTSIHSYPVLHADGRPLASARFFGAKFLREWSRTLRLINPGVLLTAEDHSGWDAVTQDPEEGGLGFGATWYSDFYHHLIGDAQNDASRARLLKFAGYGDDRELRMTWFAGALEYASTNKVIYLESHDEAGNSYYQENGQDVYSARTIVVAVNGVPPVGETRRYAEARVRFAAGVTLLGPGTPMFFMGEEVGASRPYRYRGFLDNREDFHALRQGAGAALFRYYRDVIRLRLSRPALRSQDISRLHVHDANRVLAFRRREGSEELIVVASLNNHSFAEGYEIRHGLIADGFWREILNSDLDLYGGTNLTNDGVLTSNGGVLTPRLPANSVLVFQRQ